MRSSLFLDVPQRWLGVTDVSGQPSCLWGSSSPWKIHCCSLLLPFVCLFLLVNDKRLTWSWHHVRRYAADHNMPPAVSEDEKGETEPVFFFFPPPVWRLALNGRIRTRYLERKLQEMRLHKRWRTSPTREWMQVSSWLNSFAVRLNSSRGRELSCWDAWSPVFKNWPEDCDIQTHLFSALFPVDVWENTLTRTLSLACYLKGCPPTCQIPVAFWYWGGGVRPHRKF
jgi:hypothetical protein